MTFRSDQYDYMDLDDFEELLADKPRDEKWELIGGRVVRVMVGARWTRTLGDSASPWTCPQSRSRRRFGEIYRKVLSAPQ